MASIDLNADLGEAYGPWSMGEDAKMLSLLSSANIACGGHAGDAQTMWRSLTLARDAGVCVGAHPGFNDREGFGRRLIPMSPAEISNMCAAQIGALRGVAARVGVAVRYVKPHGALANLGARDREVADSIVRVVQDVDPNLAILAISGTQLEQAARALKVPVYSEIFADRGYLSSGQLVARGQDGAMIHDAKFAADRMISFLQTGLMPVVDGPPIKLQAHSICVHGDSAGAVEMAQTLRETLSAGGFQIAPFINS